MEGGPCGLAQAEEVSSGKGGWTSHRYRALLYGRWRRIPARRLLQPQTACKGIPMKIVSVFNNTTQTTIATHVGLANNPLLRLKGLMFKPELPDGHGLWITPCNSVHMFWMRFALDVVFVAKDGTIVHLQENLKPWHLSPIFFKAHSVLEVPTGTIQTHQLAVGHVLKLLF